MRGAMVEKEPGRGLFEWLQTLMTAVVCIVLLFTFVGRVVRVDGRSHGPHPGPRGAAAGLVHGL